MLNFKGYKYKGNEMLPKNKITSQKLIKPDKRFPSHYIQPLNHPASQNCMPAIEERA